MRCLVRDLMTPISECIVVTLDTTIQDFKNLMRAKKQRMAVVCNEDNAAIGVITAHDITIAEDDELVSDHWSLGAYTIKPDKPVSIAKRLILEKSNHQLVVVDDHKIPLGVIWDYVIAAGCPDLDESPG